MRFFVRLAILIATFASIVVPGMVLAADPPIMHLKFDDGSGTAPQDSSSNNIDGAFSATQPTWSATVPDVAFANPYSLDFTGTNDAVIVNWPVGQNFGDTDPRTFSFWYRPTANGEGAYSRLISWSNDRLEIAGTENGGSTHKITYYDGSWHATDITLTLNTWYHVTFTYDGTTARFYIGDELQDEHALAGRSLSGTLYIGNRVQDGNEGINGQMDDIRIYDYALDATQVANLAAGSNDPDSPPDETAPTISNVSATGTSDGATVTWTTNEAASTRVIYGTGSATSNASTTAETDTSPRVTSHSVSLTGLLSCTSYVYKVVSRDAAGNSATSTDMTTFSTTGCPGGASPITSLGTVSVASTGDGVTGSMGGRSLKVDPPDNFTNAADTVVLQVSALTASTVLSAIGKPSNSLSTGSTQVFQVQALINNTTLLDSFDLPVSLTFTYLDSDISNLDEDSLKMYHYSGSTWTELTGCTHNTVANTIQCETDSFSIFALLGNSLGSGGGSSSQSSSGTRFGCKDKNASNYEYFSSHKQELCKYETVVPSVCSPHIKTYIRHGAENNPDDVRKLETFLNEKQGESLPIDGTYSLEDMEAVKRFQQKYASEVLGVWGLTEPTGYVYRTTLMKINSFYCNQNLTCPAFTEYNSLTENPVSAEIAKTKTLLSELGFYTGAINNTFDTQLNMSLKSFQETFRETMLKPWGLVHGTGYKYKTTNKFLNMLVGCQTPAVELDGKGMFDY